MSGRRFPFLLAALCVLITTMTPAEAQVPVPRHEGVATCASSLCHGSSRPLQAYAVLQNEYTTWSQFDPHSKAYRTLLNAQSREIARRMGLKSAHEAPECLACHAERVPVAARGTKFQLDDGVGCESCHGGAERWLSTHHQTPKVTRAENLARGLVALEDPETLAKTCLACHVGDKDRYANHRMMAAGHPRLVFELDTYLELWRTSGGREHYRKSTPTVHAALWTKGLLDAARRQLELIDRHGVGRLGPIPDFGVFACHSCHRDLRLAAFGGTGSSQGGPGELRWQDAHLLVLQQTAHALRLDSARQLNRAMLRLQGSANADSMSVKLALAETRDALTRAEQELGRRRWTPADMNAVSQSLVEASRRGAFPDPAAAEQAAMGLVVMLAGLQLDRGKRAEIDRLFNELRDDNAFDQRRFARWMSVLGAR